jgi:CPA1 family monovalent cation:H+ antiporter
MAWLKHDMSTSTLTAFDAASILIVLAAALGYFNHRVLKLPTTIGLTLMGAIASLAVIVIDQIVPGSALAPMVAAFLRDLDFHKTLMEGMLSFLLFAGALHVDWTDMRKGRWEILALSSIGVIVSTLIVGSGFWVLTALFGVGVPFIWCLVFGALISPTDPVSVLAVLKRTAVPPVLRATVAGESLFNDGVGVVIFSIVLGAALKGVDLSLGEAATNFLFEAGGGAALGLLIGWIAFHAMRSIDEYAIEVMISLAVVMGGYSVAQGLHISGPVAMAVAGLLLGNKGVDEAMSDVTQDYLIKFWGLIDDILNAILFLLIGLEVIAITPQFRFIAIGLLAIPLVILARAISVGVPLRVAGSRKLLGNQALPILIWGGLRGGISIALALSLPAGPARDVILAATYLIVMFSVIVQGGSIGRLIARLDAREA